MMAASPQRRKPLPALVFLLALAMLTGVVWWRVLHRDTTPTTVNPTPTISCPGRPTSLPKPAAVNVTVYNATTQNGLAGTVSDQLRGEGFKVADPQTSSTQLATVGEVRYGPSGKAAAILVQLYAPGTQLKQVSRQDAGVDLYLGAQFKKLASAKAVSEAQSKAANECASPSATKHN